MLLAWLSAWKGGANWNSTCSNEMRKVCWVLFFPTRLFCNASVPMIFPVFHCRLKGDFMDMVIPTMQQLSLCFSWLRSGPSFTSLRRNQSFQSTLFFGARWSWKTILSIRKSLRVAVGPFYEIYNIYQGHVIRNAFPKAGRKTCSSALSVPFQSLIKGEVCPIMPIRCSSPPSTFPP